MNNEISKKQFIIITVLIFVITVAIVATILKRTKADIVSEKVNSSNNVSSNVSMLNNDNFVSQNISTNSFEEPIILEDDIETPIVISSTSETLINLQENIDVLTNNKNKKIFGTMISPTKEEIEDNFNLNLSLIDEYIIKVSENRFSSEMYMIIKPYEKDKEEVKTEIKQFFISYAKAWSELNNTQYQLIDNKKSVERNGYLIYIVSTDNETIMNKIRESI